MSIEYKFEIHELSRIGPLSVCHNSPRTPEPKRADRKSRSAGGVTIIWIGRSGRIADTKPFILLARASSRTSRVDLPFPPRRIRRLGLHHTDAPRTRYHDSLMRLGKATLVSNQLAVHRLEFVRPRLGALRNLACRRRGRRQAVERRSNAREPGPPSFGSKARSARSAWCSSRRAGARASTGPPAAAIKPAVRIVTAIRGFARSPIPPFDAGCSFERGTRRGAAIDGAGIRRRWRPFTLPPSPTPRKTRRLALTPRIPPSWAVSATTDTPELPPTENAAFLEGKLEACVIHRRVWLWLLRLDSVGDAGWEGRVASWGERSERAGGGEAPKRRCERTLFDRLSTGLGG